MPVIEHSPAGSTVYAIGVVDYDIRAGLPSAIYATLEDAKAHAGEHVNWTEDDGEWYGNDREREWVIAAYVVGGNAR